MTAALLATAVPLTAQWVDHPTPGLPRTADGKPDLSAPPPRTADGKVDYSGIWQRIAPARRPAENNGIGPNLKDFMSLDAVIPFRPDAEALYKQRSAAFGAGRPSERCLPHSIPDAMLPGALIKFVQTPGLTVLLYEEFNHYRQVFTDGRSLPPPLQPAWFGYSVGKWDGDAFVVDTAGFNDQSWLDDWGLPHTDALHTTERFTRRDVGHMDMQLTIDDQKAYTRSWSATVQFLLKPDIELIEDICENEQDHSHIATK